MINLTSIPVSKYVVAYVLPYNTHYFGTEESQPLWECFNSPVEAELQVKHRISIGQQAWIASRPVAD